MRQISIPVHPLTRRVLLAEYGCEPIVFPNQDFTFNLLRADHIRDRAQQHGFKLTETIEVCIDDATARHIKHHERAVGLRLFRFHQQLICRHADSAFRIQGKGNIKAAIEAWLSAYGVDEDEYAVETAYKLWQRWSWKIEEKNKQFFSRRRGTTPSVLAKKNRLRATSTASRFPLNATLKEIEAELAANRFVENLRKCMRGAHKKLPVHARAYYYVKYSGLNHRQAAKRLSVCKATVTYAIASLNKKAERNRTIGLLLQEAVQTALPRP